MKKFKHFALVAMAGTALASCGLEPAEKFARAQENYAAHAYSDARLDLESALQDLPGDAAMLELLARTKIALGDGEGAMQALEKLQSQWAARPELVILAAEADILRGRFDHALTKLEGLETANAYRVKALAMMGKDQPDLALEALEKGEQATGDKADLQATFARFELARGNLSAARERAQSALKSNPTLLDALLVSGEVNIARNRLPQALEHYETANETYPENLAAMIGRAAVLGDLGRLDEAGDLLDRAANTAPDNIRVVHLKARLAVEQGKWEDARSLLQGQEAAVRASPAMQLTYATALLRLGQVEQARMLLGPLVDRNPGMRSSRSLLAEAQLTSGDSASALKTIRPIAERPDASPQELDVATKAARNAGDPSASRYAARARMPAPEWLGGELAKADSALRNQQWKKAVESYEAINQRSRRPNPMVLNNLAYAKSQLGENEAALDLALDALKLAADNPSVMDTAGWLLVETGRDKARGTALLRKASQLEPDNTGIARRLTAAERN